MVSLALLSSHDDDFCCASEYLDGDEAIITCKLEHKKHIREFIFECEGMPAHEIYGRAFLRPTAIDFCAENSFLHSMVNFNATLSAKGQRECVFFFNRRRSIFDDCP
jgi:hypothetical protein